MMTNLFADLPAHLPDELCTTLLEAADVRIGRIVSHGYASPADFCYDQDQHEWVIVLKGAARLRFEDESIDDEARRFREHPGAQEAPGRVDDAGRADDLAGRVLRREAVSTVMEAAG